MSETKNNIIKIAEETTNNADPIGLAAKKALDLAKKEDLPFVTGYIRDGVGVSLVTSEHASKALEVIAHLILQIVIESYTLKKDETEYFKIIEESLQYIGEYSFMLLESVLSFNKTAN